MNGTAVGVSKEHITKTPGVCGGRACIAGTRIRVMDVVLMHEEGGMSPAVIVEQFPTITLADVHAGLTYYHDNKAEIQHDIDEHDRVAEYGKTQPSKLKDALTKDPGLRERFGG